jgi:hypothetical protein
MPDVSAYDLKRQALWEMEGTRRAQRRYQEVAEVTDPSTLPSGKRLLRETVPPLKVAILAAQGEAQEAIKSSTGRAPLWAWPIQLLPAGALAMITLVVSLNTIRDQEGAPAAITSVAARVSGGIRDELQYRTWVAEQEKANRLAREAGDEEHVNVLARFRARYPNVDRKVWARWRRKLEEVRTGWDERTGLHLGACLISQLCQAAPTRFEAAIRKMSGGRTQRHLKLSPDTIEMLNDIETRAAVARPLLMPMLIKPLPWRYET